ncbi:MAG: DUF4124 domain-containing protein [Pseudomonas sp.]|nr:DUF4124 domain-containing protein [Pseudomonas sp.]MDD2222226.1 DUF4124 domain-containing protein [Pseudomonas sp.]MDY0414087.1 DUF4124 domain-containing protein [Pseudomonas sp.]NLO53579.1 DUF4124 domain-containing protein [Gammaproteobacteria bacterium]
MRLRGPVCCLFALGLLTCSVSYAVEYYRYSDARGITVISRQGVPSDLIGHGYDVLNEQGRVVRVVPRALTPEEYRTAQAANEQAKADRQLLMLYTRVEDIDRALERKTANIDGQISIARGNLLSVNRLKTDLQGQAASQERAGAEVSALLLEQIAEVSLDQQRLQQQIARYLQRKKEVEDAFARDKTRVVELLKHK